RSRLLNQAFIYIDHNSKVANEVSVQVHICIQKTKTMVAFSVKNKVALVTGGVAGIGLGIAKELLKKGAKGVVLADINKKLAGKALQEIEETFGKNKAIYVETDVRSIEQFEEAFQKTLESFEHVDILVNNAGILDDSRWNDEVDINVKGTINGILLGFEKYLPTSRSGKQAVILNLSSTAGVKAFSNIPIYSSTKFAIHGMTLGWGDKVHYERTKVKVIAICPGPTQTNLLATMSGKNLGAPYEEQLAPNNSDLKTQTVEQCAAATLPVIELAETGTVWVIEGGEPPYQFILPDRFKLTEKFHVSNK
ncbi:hypothetical protein D910_03010, partial [Dendroctonus ponderosae]